MKKLKVMSIFGTRPEAIKMAPLVKELDRYEEIEQIVCVTAQHREMLDQVLSTFDIKPHYDLNIMQQSQTLSQITTAALNGLEKVMAKEAPHIALVHGDTTTTLAASLAAYYSKVGVGHVEAGLRTYNKLEPFPEEMNRKLTTALSDLNFAPTELSRQNLLREGIPSESIFVTGNTVIDVLQTTVIPNYRFKTAVLNDIDFNGNKVIVMTAHRRENLGNPLENICNAVLRVVNEHKDVVVVYAVHPNPAVKTTAHRILGGHPQVMLIEPLDILEMHNLISRSYMVLTDSGGLQEEAPSLNKPVVVLRNLTERPEGLTAGTLALAGVSMEDIFNTVELYLGDAEAYAKMAAAKNPFGDGNASQRIAAALLYHYGYRKERPLDFSII